MQHTSNDRLWRIFAAIVEAILVILVARAVPGLEIIILFTGMLLVIATLHTER